jgi:hypothetical protein
LAPVGHCSKRLQLAAQRTILFDGIAVGVGGAA